jgi:hypothetical protein
VLECALALEALPRWQQAGEAVGDGVKEFADPQRLAAVIGDRVVDFADVTAQELFPGGA